MASSWRPLSCALIGDAYLPTRAATEKRRKAATRTENEENRRENRRGHCPPRLPNVSNKFLSSLNAGNFMEAVTRPRRRIYRPIRSVAINAATVPATVSATVPEEIRELCVSFRATFRASVPSSQRISRALDFNSDAMFHRSTIIPPTNHSRMINSFHFRGVLKCERPLVRFLSGYYRSICNNGEQVLIVPTQMSPQ